MIDWLFYTLKNQVMYVDTAEDRRFEISKVPQQHQIIFGDYNMFRVAEVTDPYKFSSEAMGNENRPLNHQHVNIIFKDIEWEKIKWGESSLLIDKLAIEDILSYKFYSNKIITVPDVISLD
jgi:hypothetical protein